MLTLAAMRVLNDTSDPYFTSLQAGMFATKKPKGEPCDAAFPCHHSGLSKGAKIALGVVLSIVGSVIIAAVTYIYRKRRNKF